MTNDTDNELSDFIEQSVAKAEAENRKAWQSYYEDMYAAETDELIADYVMAEISRTTPTEAERRQHREIFADFRDFAQKDHMTALPARPQIVAGYLVHLRVNEHRPMQELHWAAAAIQWVHHAKGYHVDENYIEAAIKLAAGTPDDGGGKVIPLSPRPSPPTNNLETLPMAAAGA
jgi:hypothetical protein